MRQVFFGKTAAALSAGTAYRTLDMQTNQATAAAAHYRVEADGVVRKLRMLLDAAPGAGQSWSLTVMKNGSPTAVTLTIADTATAAEDAVNEVTVAVGDTIAYRTVRGGTATLTDAATALEFESDTAGECFFGTPQLNANTSGRFFGLFGAGGASAAYATASEAFHVVPCAGAITTWTISLTVAPGAGQSKSFTIFKNGVAQDGTGGTVDTVITLSDAETTETKTFTLGLAEGDYVYVQLIKTGTPANSNVNSSIKFVSDDDFHFPIMGQQNAWQNNNSYCFAGMTSSDAPLNVESPDAEVTGPVDALTIGGLVVLLSVAPGDPGDIRTFKVRKNVADSGLVVAIEDDATLGQDTTHSTTLTNTDGWTFLQTVAGTPLATNVCYAVCGNYAPSAEPAWPVVGAFMGDVFAG